MTVIVDSRESDEYLVPLCDRQASLDVLGGTSYDLHVEAEDGAVFTAERKTWADYLGCWNEQRFVDQLAQVDILIVEDAPRMKDLVEEERKKRAVADHVTKDFEENALRRLRRLGAMVWVVQTDDPWDTVSFLRYLERKGSEVKVLKEGVKRSGATLRQALLAQMPGIDPTTVIDDDGNTKGERIEAMVDWYVLADEGFNVHAWETVPGIGPVTVEKVYEQLTKGE